MVKMGFGSEGSLVLKHDNTKLFSNKELQVIMNISMVNNYFKIVQKLINDAEKRKEQRKNQRNKLLESARNKLLESTRAKHVTFKLPEEGSHRGHEGQRRQNISEVVKKMDISHTGYLTVLVYLKENGPSKKLCLFSGNQDLFSHSL